MNWKIAATGIATGFLAGLLGVGGGIITIFGLVTFDTSTLKRLILGGIAGVLIGGFVALQTDGDVLRAIYTGFVFFLSYRFLKPQKARAR